MPDPLSYSKEQITQYPDKELEEAWSIFRTYSLERQRLRETVQRFLRKKSPPRNIKAEEIAEGGLTSTKLGEKDILLAKVQGKVYAMDNTCSHSGYPLSEGKLDGYVVTCKWHAAKFDVRSGTVVAPGAEIPPLRCFQIQISNNGTLEFEDKQ